MSTSSAFNDARKGNDPQSTSAAVGVLIASLVLTPLLFLVLWNYGATELLEEFGGPDANLGVIEGVLTVYFLRVVARIARGG